MPVLCIKNCQKGPFLRAFFLVRQFSIQLLVNPRDVLLFRGAEAGKYHTLTQCKVHRRSCSSQLWQMSPLR